MTPAVVEDEFVVVYAVEGDDVVLGERDGLATPPPSD